MDTPMFSGLNLGMGNLPQLSHARPRSISAENRTGEKGRGGMALEGTGAGSARDLGQGWKISPSVVLPPRSVFPLAFIQEPGAIQHLWMTTAPQHWRHLIFRAYWDGEEAPSIECPYGDFFANGWCEPCQISSLPVAVNPVGGMNVYWPMPFRQSARLTLENLSEEEVTLFYQVDYVLTDVPPDSAYFHAQWRRSNPLAYKEVHTLLEGVRGQGHYVGTYLAWQSNAPGWWGEGEIKFYLDGDDTFPTICGTGTEDYVGGAWCFASPEGRYSTYTTPFLGLPQVLPPEAFFQSGQRFGLYRWHILDPIRFEHDLRVTIQGLGWREGGLYLPLQDDIASTAFWYQREPHTPFPPLAALDIGPA